MTVTTVSGCTVAPIRSPPTGSSTSKATLCSGALHAVRDHLPGAVGCGNVYVHGSYSGQLTIAAENDVVVDGNLTTAGGGAMLGLIANNFVRVYHPCSYGTNGSGLSWKTSTIDAAILAINHSFIVDNYNCGASLGTLTVHGAIAQKFRGPVGTVPARTGYIKNYVYDDRLRYVEPPNFIDPVQSAWVVGRETVGMILGFS